MYALILGQQNLMQIRKMVLGIIVSTIFTMLALPLNAYETGEILKGYIQEKTMIEKSDNNALFLLEENWEKELREKYKGYKISKIDSGIMYIPMKMAAGKRRARVNVIEVNRKFNTDLEIIPVGSGQKLHTKAKLSSIAVKNEAIIAINGGFFKPDTGTPLGALMINNQIITGPIFDRVGFLIGENSYKTANIKFEGEIKKKNEVIKIDNINQPRISAKYVLLYTSKWGIKAPVTSKPSIYIGVKNNKITAKSNKPLEIEQNGYVISAPENTFKNFKVGDRVELNYSLIPKWQDIEHIIGAGPYLMKEGSVYIDTTSEKLSSITGRNPRSAIGYTLDNVMILVTVEGRKEGINGVTLNELAQLMKKLGCYEAVNLDGGSSTAMYVDGKTLTGSNVKGAASINNAIIVRKKVS